MIQIPALFWTLPAVAPATLLGTSTLAGIWGTAAAAVNFSRRIKVTWTTAVPAAVAAFILSFLGASAVAKVVNVACNLAALLWFGFSGHLLWQAGIVMAPFNVVGSLIESRLALRHGSGFVQKNFLVVVAMLILKTGYEVFLHQATVPRGTNCGFSGVVSRGTTPAKRALKAKPPKKTL